jgi:hypothetical protein
LTLKTFALSSLVAYLGLGLSAFVYVPFGEGVMCAIQTWLFKNENFNMVTGGFAPILRDMLNGTVAPSFSATQTQAGIWDVDRTNARAKLDSGRLTDQMFAYTITSQVMDTFTEIGLPFLWRRLDAFRKGKTTVKGLVSLGGGESANVKKCIQYKPGMSWWAGELCVLASVPVIILFAGLLSAILTAIFVFEAFVTQLYKGPGKQLIVSIVY